MLLHAVHLDLVPTLADGVAEGRFFVQSLAELVEVGDRDLRPALHLARIRAELTEDEFQQRRFPAAVRPDEADLVAAQDAAGKILHHRDVGIFLRNVLELRDKFAGALAFRKAERHLADALAAGGAPGLRCACGARRCPCGSRPPPARAPCRTCAGARPRRRALPASASGTR